MRPLSELFDPDEYYRFTLRHVALKYAHSAYNRFTADCLDCISTVETVLFARFRHPSDLSGPWEDHPYCKACGVPMDVPYDETHQCCETCEQRLGL